MEEISENDSVPSFSPSDINTVELPPCIDVRESIVHKGEAGAFAKTFISKDTRFGPYKGEIINPGQKNFIDYRYAWEVHEKRSRHLKYTISALDPKVSNWMRHVNNARFYEEQNILSVQDGFSIFYVAMKNIEEGQELLTWFDPKLLKRTQRRQIRAERRPIGYTIELVPWSDEKKFTPEIIETKRSRKKKVRSDMIALDEDPKAMTRTLQSLPKIPCTPRQLGNMAYPLANSLKRKKKDKKVRQRQAEMKDFPEKSNLFVWEKDNVSHTPVLQTEQKLVVTEKKQEPDLQKLNALPPHENLKEALQAAENGPKLLPPPLLSEAKAPTCAKAFTNLSEGQDKIKKKRGRKRLSDLPGGRSRLLNTGFMNLKYSSGVIRPLGLKTNSDGSLKVEDHDESYTLTGVTIGFMCDDKCPCLDKVKCMGARDPPSAANSYAMGFTLLPEHQVVQHGKTVYKCDVCDGIYNHAFSLKRHYLSVHINHRYLTRNDIISCQIDTFHKGIQMEESKPPLLTVEDLQKAGPAPTFRAVNLSNLLPAFSMQRKPLDDVEAKRLEELGGKLLCHEKLSDEKHLKKVNVSKATIEKQSVPTLASLAQNCLNHVALECKKAVNSKACIRNTESQSKKDDQSFLPEKTTDCEASRSTDPINENSDVKSQSEHLSVAPAKGEKETNNDSLSSFENKSSDFEDSRSKTEVSIATSCDDNKFLNANSMSTNEDKENQERESLLQKKVKRPDTITSEKDNSNVSGKSAKDTCCLANGASEKLIESTSDSLDNTDSSVAFTSDLSTSSIKTPAAEAAEGPPPLSCDHSKVLSPKTEKESVVVSSSEKDDKNTEPASNPSDADKSNDILAKDSLKSESSSSSSPSVSNSFDKPPLPASIQQQSTASGQAGKTSVQPPVIFLTNIVFPVPGTLGQSVMVPQRPLLPTAVQKGTANLPAGTLPMSSQPPINLVQTMGSNVRLPGPRAPIPLVLISQVPPGVDPRNAANTFLKTSTGIKTLQDLQKSLTVAAMSNISTQPTASNRPGFIGPLCQGANAQHNMTANPIIASGSTLPVTASGLTNLSPRVSLSVPISLTAASTVNGGMATVSSSQTGTSHSPLTTKSSTTTSSVSPSVIRTLSSSNSTTMSPAQPSTARPAQPGDQPEDLFRCHMCVLVFQTMQQLKHHIRNDPHRFKGGIKQYACLQCNMRFSTKSNLARHNLMNHTETEEYMYRCSTCGKGFSSETYLKMHARFHLGKSFPCKYGCKDLYFPNAATLVKHLRVAHAGLDLKEYKRIHKIRPARRKKVSQIVGQDFTNASLSMSAPHMYNTSLGPQGFRSPLRGISSATHGHVISPGDTSSSKESSPYSLMEPGVGFQAKRGRPKGSKNKIKNGKPIFPSPVNSPNLPPPQTPPPLPPLPLTVEIPPAMGPKKLKRKIARFKCKICPKKFTTHLKLLRHRRRKHGMDQSVQEYLHIMSKNLDGYISEPDQTIYSPPASPKTFFSTVCQRGYENFTQFIDGGPESLKSPIRKYVDIKGFSSISAPFDSSQEQHVKLEWTAYNFPPSFTYKYDSTTFYDAEEGENFTTLSDKRLASVKTDAHSENERDSTPEMENSENEKVNLLNEDPLAPLIKAEESMVKESHCTTNLTPMPAENQQDKEDKKPDLGNFTNQGYITDSKKEDSNTDSRKTIKDTVFTIGSRERGKQVIENLARHLACEKLPDGDSDHCEFVSQGEDDCDGDLPKDLNIKAELVDGSLVAEVGGEKTVEKETSHDTDVRSRQEHVAVDLKISSENSQNSCTEKDKNKSKRIEMQNNAQVEAPTGEPDSSLGSLSSNTSDKSPHATQSCKNGLKSEQDSPHTTSNTGVILKQSSASLLERKDVAFKTKDVKSNTQDQFAPEGKLPILNAMDKNKLMRSPAIQSLITGDCFDARPKNFSRSLANCSTLNALDLCVPGGQLSAVKLAQMMKSASRRQELCSTPGVKAVRHRCISLPSFKEGEVSLNSSDAGKHQEHKKLSLWGGHLPQNPRDPSCEEAHHYCPIVNTVQKEQALKELESYKKAKMDQDKSVDRKHFPEDKLVFAESMGLMTHTDFAMYPKPKEYNVIKPPEVWANYENIWFGKRGTIVVVCSICHRHFSCWDLCLRHQLKKHPHIEPNFLQMEKGNYVDDMYYYYPMKYGILAKTEPIPSNLALPELYVCTRCGFPFRNVNRLHAHIVSCDPSLERGASYKSFQNRKKLIPMMDRRLSQQDIPDDPTKLKLGRPLKRPPVEPSTPVSGSGSGEKLSTTQPAQPDLDRVQSPGCFSLSQPFSFYNGRRRKNYELLYNPQNHMRRRELYQVLDTHQCHGCNLKFKSMSMLERHVKKCSGRDRLQNQKPLLSGIMPDDAAVRKQHTCRYCSKRFTYIKGVDLHYKRICSVRKVKEEEGKLTPEDLAHEEELRRIIEHLKWSKTLNQDSSDIIQGNVRVEEDGSLTRLVKKRGFPAGTRKRVKKRKVKNKKWTYMKNHRHANRSASSAALNIGTSPQKPEVENSPCKVHREDDLQVSASLKGRFGFQKRKSPVSEHSPPPKKRASSDFSPSVSNTSAERTLKSAPSPTGKRGRPRKYALDDPRAYTPRLTRSNSAASKAQKNSDQANALKPSSSEADLDLEASDRPEPRKRGRPKKFDPSDMESSYKKKKKAADLKLTEHRSDSSTVLPPEESAGRTVTRRQQRAKIPTAAVKEDFMYEDPNAKKKSLRSRNKDEASQDRNGVEEKSPFSEIELMEKMKQLKKAAQLESDKYKLKQEQRKAKAKKLQNVNNSGSSKIPDTLPPSSSSELFKHLTAESPLLSPKSKSCIPQKEHSPQITILSGKASETILGGKVQSRKSSPASNTSITVARPDSKKSVKNPKLVSTSAQIRTPEPSKGVDSRMPKLKNSLITGTPDAGNEKPPKKSSSFDAIRKNVKPSVLQMPECSVKVVTLSPKATSLMVCKDVSENGNIETRPKCSNQTSSKLEINEEKPKTPITTRVIVDKNSHIVDKVTAKKSQDMDLSPPKKHKLEKSEEQTSSTSEISTDLSLYSTGEELLTLADKISTSSQSSNRNLEKTEIQAHHASAVEMAKHSASEKSSSSDSAADNQLHHKTVEENQSKAAAQEPSGKRTTETKIVFLQPCKTPQISGSIKYGHSDLVNSGEASRQPSYQTALTQSRSPQTIKLPTAISTLNKSKIEKSKTVVSHPVSGVVDACQKINIVASKSNVPFAVIEGSSVIEKKSLSTPIKVIKGGLPPNKTPSVAPITVFSPKRVTLPVSISSTTHSFTVSGSVNNLTSLANSCSPMTTLATQTDKSDLSESSSYKQCKSAGATNLTTHFQIKGGVVTHKPGTVQTNSSSLKAIPIVSSLNPARLDIPVGPKLITTAVPHPSSVGPVRPVISQIGVKTSAKIISPPARVISQTASPAGSARPLLINPHKTVIQIPSAGMRPVQVPASAALSGKLKPTLASAAPNFQRMPVVTGNLPRPQFQAHVIRTMLPSKTSASSSTQCPPSIIIPTPTSGHTTNRSVAAWTTANTRTTLTTTKPSLSSMQCNIVRSPPAPFTVISPTQQFEQVYLHPETPTNTGISESVEAFSLTANDATSEIEFQGEPLIIKPPSNPIMITLEDGSTAMLDPESLAQLLSPVEENVPAEPEPGQSMMVPDPGSVMVNMGEIQPGQGALQSGEVLWEGFPDMSDSADLFIS